MKPILILALFLCACGSAETAGASDPSTGGECPPGGVEPVNGPDGMPENCSVLFEGCCFADAGDACRAANCGDQCDVMESYPGQVSRCE